MDDLQFPLTVCVCVFEQHNVFFQGEKLRCVSC